MHKRSMVILLLGVFALQAAHAQGGGGGGKKGRGENATAIVTVLTQDVTVTEGLFSDEWAFGDPDSSLRYYGTGLNGQQDPHNPGDTLADGDCVAIIVPAADGVDQGKFVIFAPFGTADCPDASMLRQFQVLGSGQDLNGDLAGDPELVDVRMGCDDVFPNDSPIGGTTSTSCSLEVREYTHPAALQIRDHARNEVIFWTMPASRRGREHSGIARRPEKKKPPACAGGS